MRIETEELVSKLHVIIDDVARDEADDFSADQDAELREALLTGAERLTSEVPAGLLQPVGVIASLGDVQDYDAIQTQYTDGHGSLVVPDDFLRIGELKLKSWMQSVRTLMEPDSDEAKMQACRWTRGTPQKPKAMVRSDASGRRVVEYWTAGRYRREADQPLASVYDHEVERFTYAPRPRFETETTTADDGSTTSTEYLYVPVVDACEKALLYRAAGIYMEAKGESQLADRLYGVVEN